MADQASKGVGAIGRGRASVAAIETLAKIRSQRRKVATDGERVTLSGWTGWGALAKAFAPDGPAWVDMGERIDQALPEEDVRLGLKGTYMAYYTPTELAAGLWQVLGLLGYDGGPVAELGCGGGAFFAAAPEGTPLVGVERDPTAAGICQLLHPDVKVINAPLEDTHLPATFAAVIGNVPFGDVAVFDPTAPDEVRTSLHNYFIWRAVQALAPGGMAVLITSRHTMDSWSFQGREAIAKDADFVGAIRLPNGALGDTTEAAADVVILRRKGGTGKRTYPQAWKDSAAVEWDRYTTVNAWWLGEPGAVLGTMKKGPVSIYGLGLTVEPDGKGDTIERMLGYVRNTLVPQARDRNLMWTPPHRPDVFDAAAAGVVSKEGWHEGTMRLDGHGGVLVVKGGKAHPLPRAGKELLRLLRLRDLAVELVRLEADHSIPDMRIEPVRADVRAAYQDYVRHHGPLNRYTQRPAGFDDETGIQQWRRTYPTMQGFRHDPDAPLVFALEMFDDDDDGDTDEEEAGSRARPAPIQESRQNIPPARRNRTDDPEQALAWTLDRFGKVHLGYVAALLGRPLPDEPGDERDAARAEIAALLGDKVYQDTASLMWVTAEEYCSGDVRRKHDAAKVAAEQDPRFVRNVAALEKVLPPWLGPEDITANLGTPWIGPDDVRQFIGEVIGYQATVKRISGQWEIEAQGAIRTSVAGSTMWGTPEKDAFELVDLALNGKTPTIYKEVRLPGKEDPVRVKDHEKSMLAAEKQQEIRARFGEWVWECPDRTKRLVHLYNYDYNNLAPRRFDGSHITVDGMAPWFNPYDHQREFVARALGTPAALCGHPVGAGKTYTMAMVAMKLKQVGLVNKPMIVVPNHLIEQIDREIRQLFPGAKILTGSSKTVAANRLAFTARCSTGDWDIVLVTHSAFNAMDVDPETQARYYEDLENELYEGFVAGAGGKLGNGLVKRLAKALDKMKTKVRNLRHTARGRDAGVRFEQLGVDYVLVDEFHYYKNLAVPVRTEGFSVRPSKRATDLDMKLRYLSDRKSGGPHAALFSGTPVSNTMLELYVCLHYTMRDHLRLIGIGSADAWAAAYVQFVTSVEVTVDGGDFQMRTRPALFVNAPELRVLLSQAADIRTAEQLGLKRPSADLRVVACEPTEIQAWYSTELVERAEDVRNKRVEPDQDNMLKICTDGRRMATDPHLIGLPDDGEYKLHIVAQTIIGIWQANPGKLQMGFLDIGTPGKARGADKVDYKSYGRLRRMLTDAGMDVRRIRFIHDAKSDSDKARMFRDCRRGKVDVILGSTDKLGVGTNVQKLIVAMHHIDAPFRPADVEQRDGRGLRPGNIHKTVLIFRYVTKRTFDAYMWQMLTRKLGFISQMLSGNLDRTIEDVTGDDVLSFGAIKAAATDQPLLQEKAVVDATIKKLKLKERSHRQTVQRMRKDAPRLRAHALGKQREAESWETVAAAAEGVELTDEVVKTVYERMKDFRYYPEPLRLGGLTVGWRRWQTKGEEPEQQPLLVVQAGVADVEEQCYKFWKQADVTKKLKKLLGNAAGIAALHRKAEAEALRQARECDELADKPFEHAAELHGAQARLDQINAELHDAASNKQGPDEGDTVIPLAEEFDLGAMGDFAGEVMSDLESSVSAGIADLMGEGLGDLFT
jgi:N12 class adenine-specific DNA methylase